MPRLGEKPEGITVPQFGGWDNNKAGETNYSMVFSQARAKKKRSRSEGPYFKPNPIDESMPNEARDTLSPPPASYTPSPIYHFQPPSSPEAFKCHQKKKWGLKNFMKKLTGCMRARS